MTIDEAIARIREVAEKHRNNIVPKERYNNMPWIDKSNEVSMRSAEEHEQLVEWLEELKEYKATLLTPQMIEELKKSEKQAHKIAIQNAMLAEDSYNKALDDIVTIIKERVGMDWEWDFCFIEQIAEQLKAGGMNEYNI